MRPSTLGEAAGLGLFARERVQPGEVVSTYHGSLLYKEEMAPEAPAPAVVPGHVQDAPTNAAATRPGHAP